MTAERALNAMRAAARRLPDVEEGIACAGTPIERSTFKTKKKAFVFFGLKNGGFDVMVKLAASLPEAKKLGYAPGANGWVKVSFAKGESPPRGLLEKWIAESHGLMAKPKTTKKTTKRKT